MPTPEAGPGPVVRELVMADAASLAEIHAAAFANPWTAAEFARLLAGRGCFGCRADRVTNGAPAGFLLVRVAADQGEILTLAVVPEMRRRGIGHALLTAALDTAARRGIVWMFLEVAADNMAAKSLYARHGFAAVGRREGYYRSPEGRRDALVLCRALDERVDAVAADSYNNQPQLRLNQPRRP